MLGHITLPKGPSVFRLHDHTERLFKSASTVNMAIPYSVEDINKAHIEVIQVNNLQEAYIRPMCFMDQKAWALEQTI